MNHSATLAARLDVSNLLREIEASHAQEKRLISAVSRAFPVGTIFTVRGLKYTRTFEVEDNGCPMRPREVRARNVATLKSRWVCVAGFAMRRDEIEILSRPEPETDEP